ncbi:hypothetical protein [Zhenhengia yiwuensis]|uniref:Uncharacterized protein n=1 Tax=Zhenhengia yiwuensis TaxID=2763666 RepID=A0A926EH65_9FIRM|nr:hypothetical protein [Zhenhengia yiwuensis]MBC8581096.1 hypothetical protein [Zhenhengia yiwuensis]
MYYKDYKGTPIEKGDRIRYKKHEGMVVEENCFERREGLYATLNNGFKIRIQDVHKQVRVIQKKKLKKLNNRKNALQIPRK